MSGSPSIASPASSSSAAGVAVTSPTPSPRRSSFVGPASPKPNRVSLSARLPSISAAQLLELDPADPLPPRSKVHGFSPTPTPTPGPASPRPPHLVLSSSSLHLARLSPQLSTPVEQSFQYAFPPEGSSPSPHGPQQGELPPRSRRNSAAIVSISLSSRSRSRTPRGSMATLQNGGSGTGTPSKGSSTLTPRADDGAKEVLVQMSPSSTDFEDDWQPTGGMLLDDGDNDDIVADEQPDDEDEYEGRAWSGVSESSQVVQDVLRPGMIFGEGLEFQGEVVEPAVGKVGSGSDGEYEDLPLRRGESEHSKQARGDGSKVHREKKQYEVIRQLGSGSYAVVYLVRERGPRKREFALKCLSKQDLEDEQIETQLFEATIHLSLPIHTNIVTLHQTLQTRKWLFLMLELCPGEDLFFWLEKSRDASPPMVAQTLHDEHTTLMSSSKFSSSSIPFSSSQLFSGFQSHMASSFSASPSGIANHGASPASLLFAHNNNGSHHFLPSQTPPTPSLLSAFSANTLLSPRRLRLIASMFSQMCEAVSVCHAAGVSHRDIKPENFICCDSTELEETSADAGDMDFGPQAKRKVIVKLTDFGLATTEEESGDVECGSKPYMSYECRNNLGPTYQPAPADVWSLGIVLINMLFHRNPWKDPTEGDPNFDNFLGDPVSFLVSKFAGIGREVAVYLATRVLCVDVEARVSAAEFGKWIRSLPEMIGGRKAMYNLKMAKIDASKAQADQGLFVKSPLLDNDTDRKVSTSALTSSAPTLSGLPPPQHLSVPPVPSTIGETSSPLPTPDLERDDIRSATTVDDQPTPADSSDYPSPTSPEPGADEDDEVTTRGDADSRSLSTHKRRKRGVRKGKAAQAAMAAAASGDKPSQEERDALLRELASASQSLARDLSKHTRSNDFDATLDEEDFPPLGTTPSQAAAAKKSKWRDMMKLSSGNPELAALARRVAERDAGSGGNWSAPAQLQHDPNRHALSKPPVKQTATMSSGISSALSSFGPVSSATSSSGGAEEEDWRRPRQADEAPRGRDRQTHGAKREKDESSRARKAAQAAAALTGGAFEPMGSFGRGPPAAPAHGPLYGKHLIGTAWPPVPPGTGGPQPRPPPRSNLSHSSQPLESIVDEDRSITSSSFTTTTTTMPKSIPSPNGTGFGFAQREQVDQVTMNSLGTRQSLSSVESSTMTIKPDDAAGGPNKPKLKGQIASLAKMLSGLKTKGKE